MDNSEILLGDTSIHLDGPITDFIAQVSKALNSFGENDRNIDSAMVSRFRNVAIRVLDKMSNLKSNEYLSHNWNELVQLHNSILSHVCSACSGSDEELCLQAFGVLIELLPQQSVLTEKNSFPDNNFAGILKIIILAKGSTAKYLSSIEELLQYPDISRNIWKALEIACCKEISKLSVEGVKNVLDIVNLTEKPGTKGSAEFGPELYYCRVSEGLLCDKDVGRYIKKIWTKLVSVDLPVKLLQSLLLTLHEKLMPRMTRPIFLTDFFMTTLEYGGSISILALQGIFTLYKDENMNYPDVYTKLYSMVTPDIFEAQYKARFYYLTDIFLSSSHLPEGLVASFIKRFARLSLVAPPPDALILIVFIENLLIRHRGLKKLVQNPTNITYVSDPYKVEEADPGQTGAAESSLWEIQLLESHVVPAVSSAATFIRQPPPGVELDMSALLETTSDEIFVKEHKKKMKTPPVSFERPTSIFVPNVQNSFSMWSFGS